MHREQSFIHAFKCQLCHLKIPQVTSCYSNRVLSRKSSVLLYMYNVYKFKALLNITLLRTNATCLSSIVYCFMRGMMQDCRSTLVVWSVLEPLCIVM